MPTLCKKRKGWATLVYTPSRKGGPPATLREYYLEWQQTKFRVEVFDCPKRGFRNFADRESANQYRDSLVSNGVQDANIRIVSINSEGAAGSLWKK